MFTAMFNLLLDFLFYLLFSSCLAKPKIYSPSGSTTYVTALTNMTLRCIEDDGREIEWLYNHSTINRKLATGYEVVSKADFLDSKLVTYSNLTKISVTFQDSGIYTCKQLDPQKESYSIKVEVVQAQSNDICTYTVKDARKKITLNCSIDHSGFSIRDIQWTRYGNFLQNNSHYKLTWHSLTIEHVDYTNDLGPYQCIVTLLNDDQLIGNVTLSGIPIINLRPSESVKEGNSLTINCTSKGGPKPKAEWQLSTASDRVKFEQVDDSAMLTIKKVTYDDRREYVCFASNACGNNTKTVLVRVKGKLSELWPFLGICIEVGLLCTIIFAYERRRAKFLQDENDRIQEEQLMLNSHPNSDTVRHRRSK